MTKEEMEHRCKEALKMMGIGTPGVVGGVIAGLIYELREWNVSGSLNREELEMEIGHSYAALKMLELYIEADPERIQMGIEEALSK